MRPLTRSEPRSTVSFALSVGVHVLLIAVLFFAISWKTKPPAPVVAELWTPPEVPPPPPAPKPEPPQAAPKPEPKLEPKVEPKPLPKPDIALEREKEMKRLEELERKRQEEERKRQELEKKRRAEERERQEAEKKRKEEEARAKAEREKKEHAAEERRLKRELEDAREQRMKDQLARELGSTPPAARTGVPVPGDPRATAGWVDMIRAKIKGNVVLPPDFAGNPEAWFSVEQLPSGDIVSVKLARSSGSKALDDAWERAILKSSPLPQPDKREVFQSTLLLKFRPREER
jgi:colicin import membrane protein